jgi:hypothetical protein
MLTPLKRRLVVSGVGAVLDGADGHDVLVDDVVFKGDDSAAPAAASDDLGRTGRRRSRR